MTNESWEASPLGFPKCAGRSPPNLAASTSHLVENFLRDDDGMYLIYDIWYMAVGI